MAQHMYCTAYWFASQELQRCLGHPCNTCEEKSGCSDLQTLIWAPHEHCCHPWLCVQLSPRILTMAAQDVLSSYSLVELILYNHLQYVSLYHSICSCANIAITSEYLYIAMPMLDVLLHHLWRNAVLVRIHGMHTLAPMYLLLVLCKHYYLVMVHGAG